MRQSIQEFLPSLDQFSEFASNVPGPNENSVVRGYLTTAVAGFGNAGLGTIANWELYRIYGAFGPDQRQRLSLGEKLATSALSLPQVDALSRLTYGRFQTVTFGIAPTPVDRKFGSSTPAVPADNTPQVGFEDEATELLPNGIHPQGVIEMETVSEPFFTPATSDPQSAVLPRVLGIAQLARRTVNLEQPRNENNASAIPFKLFRIGTRTLHALTIHVAANAYVNGRLYDFSLPSSATPLAVSEFPTDIKAEFDKRVAQFRMLLAAQKANEGKQSAPPPR